MSIFLLGVIGVSLALQIFTSRRLVGAVVTVFVVWLLSRFIGWNADIPYWVWPIIAAASAAVIGLAILRRSPAAERTAPR